MTGPSNREFFKKTNVLNRAKNRADHTNSNQRQLKTIYDVFYHLGLLILRLEATLHEIDLTARAIGGRNNLCSYGGQAT